MRVPGAWLLLLGGVVAGCFRLSQPSPDIREYRLDYPPPTVGGQGLPVTLRIAPLGVAAMYDRQAIAYSDGPYSGGTYYYARWSTNPSAMITDLLARDFVASHLYTAVQQGPSAVPNDYQVGGEIEEIAERSAPTGCSAQLRLRVLLVRVRAAATPVVSQTSYAAVEPCTCNDPRALAQAMSQAMARVSEQLQQAVYDSIAKDRARS
jgi:ABC-type uncharacterized transport system auxiliary subunit